MNSADGLDFIVADDHSLVRQGVRMVLESNFAHCRVIEAADLDATLDAVTTYSDALLLIDLDMPGMDGIESLRALRQNFPKLVMAVLSGNVDRALITQALNAGVNGYILKADPPEELLYAISTIRGGRVYLTDVLWKMAEEVVPNSTPTNGSEPGLLVLTPRQREVITHLRLGHSNKQIARDLKLGEGTVKIHVTAVFRRLRAQNRTEAVLIAGRLGL